MNSCCHRQIKLILTDIAMPEMDGFQLTKQIKLIEENWYNQMRQSRSFRATKAKFFCPIIAVTSYTAKEVYDEASAAGI